jgi:hypothetical protein
MIYAVVKKGLVINLVEWNGSDDWQPQTGVAVRVPDGVVVNIGDEFEDGQFISE